MRYTHNNASSTDVLCEGEIFLTIPPCIRAVWCLLLRPILLCLCDCLGSASLLSYGQRRACRSSSQARDRNGNDNNSLGMGCLDKSELCACVCVCVCWLRMCVRVRGML